MRANMYPEANPMDTPADTPQHNPKKRKDQRPTLTFKGDEFGPEFRALINKAAERAGMSQSQFVAETLQIGVSRSWRTKSAGWSSYRQRGRRQRFGSASGRHSEGRQRAPRFRKPR